MESLTPADVQAALDAWNLGLRIRFFDNSTATSQLAADNIGCQLGQIAKSLAFIVDGTPILVVASGDQRVDERKIASRFNVGRKKVKFASPEQCVEIYGYAPGGMPPVGHRTKNLPVLLDDSFQRYEDIYPAGGANNAIFHLKLAQLAQITGGEFADVKRDATSNDE